MTFRDLGLAFSLFAASIEDSGAYVGDITCASCHLPNEHGFKLGIGDDLILSCPTCDVLNALDADDEEDTPCTNCATVIAFPEVEGGVHVCYACLRAGKAAFTHDTELGMVRWGDAMGGCTHGVPGDVPTEFETSENEDGWHQVHVPSEDLLELVRTPGYLSWQGEIWLFCHGRPMTYLGAWRQEDFHRAAPDGDGKALFIQVMEDVDESFWSYLGSPDVGAHVFGCRSCGHHRGHHDAS